MRVTISDVNESDNTLTLSESQNGNVVVLVKTYKGEAEVIVKPDELMRAITVFASEDVE